MSFQHRVPALCTAVMSSAAVILVAFAGISCNFLTINTITSTSTSSTTTSSFSSSSTFGVLCDEHELYIREGDRYWEMSRIFLVVTLALGSLTAALAWAITTFVPPTEMNWKLLSFVSAATAVVAIPIFVLFESEPCTTTTTTTVYQDGDGNGDENGNDGEEVQQTTCSLGPGSYLLVTSVVLYVAVTLCTQCLDPPRWAMELSLWRVSEPQKKGTSRPRSRSRPSGRREGRDDEGDADDDASFVVESKTSLGAIVADDDEEEEGQQKSGIEDEEENVDIEDPSLTTTRFTSQNNQKRDGNTVDNNVDDDNFDVVHYRIERVLPTDDDDYDEEEGYHEKSDGQDNMTTSAVDTEKLLDQQKQKEQKQRKGNPSRWMRWFGRYGSTDRSDYSEEDDGDDDDVVVPNVETQSTKDDSNEYYEYEEDRLDEERVILRVLPDQKSSDGCRAATSRNIVSLVDKDDDDDDDGSDVEEADSMANIADNDVDVIIMHQKKTGMMSSNKPDDQELTKLRSMGSLPRVYTYTDPLLVSQHDDDVGDDDVDVQVERHHELDSFADPTSVRPASSEDILVDLHQELLITKVASKDQEKCDEYYVEHIGHSDDDEDDTADDKQLLTSTENGSKNKFFGVRNITKKFKRESRRRRGRRQGARRGYAQMDDDDEFDDDSRDGAADVFADIEYPHSKSKGLTVSRLSDDDEYNSDDGIGTLRSPPFEVQFPFAAGETDGPNLGDTVMPDISDDEDDPLDNENWDIVGIVKEEPGDNVGLGDAFGQVTDEVSLDRDQTDPYHSDPEENTKSSFDDILPPPTLFEIAGDSSTISSGDHSGSQGNSDSRGRQTIQNDPGSFGHPRRRKRAISPVGSIKSHGSLLHMTINEETPEDIEKELGAAYSLSRTLSAPALNTNPIPKVTPKDNGSSDAILADLSAVRGNNTSNLSLPSTARTEENNRTAVQAEEDADDDRAAQKDKTISPVKTTWKEPDLSISLSTANHSCLPPLPPYRRNNDEIFGVDMSGDTTETEKTDSTAGSTLSDEEDEPQVPVRRSRSMGPSSRRLGQKLVHHSASLSPSRFWKDTDKKEETDEINRSSMARALRLRRLQKKTGYVPLDNDFASPQSPKKTESMNLDDDYEASTPKRKTVHVTDEKKEDDSNFDFLQRDGHPEKEDFDGNMPVPFLGSNMSDGLSLPDLTDKDSVVQYIKDDPLDLNVDSVLEKLDLELIHVRRPAGREYGDDELSL